MGIATTGRRWVLMNCCCIVLARRNERVVRVFVFVLFAMLKLGKDRRKECIVNGEEDVYDVLWLIFPTQ